MFLKIFHFVIVIVSFSQVYSLPFKYRDAVSCQSCHPVDSNKINIHLIPHSHDDLGWLKTVDQYFYGYHNDIANAGVQYIITSTVEALKTNPLRRYVQVETGFFWKWWQHQDDNVKQDFIDLVNNGQIEIINAAWSMNDEANTNYQSTIDQFTWGLRIINDTIGECGIPRVGWQIDPFGHSREQASIFSQLGFDGVFIARLDHNDKERRVADRDMELIWKGSANLANSDIFTNIFPNFYFAPDGFCFDIQCSDVIITDEGSFEYNLQDKITSFVNFSQVASNYYRTSNVLFPMGGDFQYQAAEVNYRNIDLLIEAFENHESVNVIYSTPSCYIKAVNDEVLARDIELTEKTDDFFPYGSDDHTFWTGYFTSRPNAKRFERLANNILQAGKQLTSFSKVLGNDQTDSLIALKQAIGVLQHHDAITGTAKQTVANDYSRMLTRALKLAEPSIQNSILSLLLKDNSVVDNLNVQTCLLANVSICEPSSSERFIVTVYNPLERPVTQYVRLPVPDGTYQVTGPDGDEVVDVLDSISGFDYLNDFGDLPNPAPKELVFAARDLPPFGIKLYYVQRGAAESVAVERKPNGRFGTEVNGFEIDDDTGLLRSVTVGGQTVEVTQDFYYYNGNNGDSSNGNNRASGAYIFRPKENEAHRIADDQVTVTSTSGNLVDEVRQRYSDWVTQIIRVYKGDEDNYIEFDWLVGPIQVDEGSDTGREVITRFTVQDFNSAQTFYTDSNGRELIQRQLNKRPDFEYDSDNEPVSSNYYPVTSRIVLRDEERNLEVGILNDRAQGGSSLSNGQLELMVHRRLLRDDNKGVDEALNETEFNQGIVARGQNYLVLGPIDPNVDQGVQSTAAQERILALKKLLAPVVLVGDAGAFTFDQIQELLNLEFNGLQATLPENVHILTLEPWKEDSYILRLEHILERNEDSNLSQSVTVDLSGLFTLFEITEIKETTLGANQWLDEFERKEKYVWNVENGKKTSYKKSKSVKPRADEIEITLDPMQIRTFIIKVATV